MYIIETNVCYYVGTIVICIGPIYDFIGQNRTFQSVRPNEHSVKFSKYTSKSKNVALVGFLFAFKHVSRNNQADIVAFTAEDILNPT